MDGWIGRDGEREKGGEARNAWRRFTRRSGRSERTRWTGRRSWTLGTIGTLHRTVGIPPITSTGTIHDHIHLKPRPLEIFAFTHAETGHMHRYHGQEETLLGFSLARGTPPDRRDDFGFRSSVHMVTQWAFASKASVRMLCIRLCGSCNEVDSKRERKVHGGGGGIPPKPPLPPSPTPYRGICRRRVGGRIIHASPLYHNRIDVSRKKDEFFFTDGVALRTRTRVNVNNFFHFSLRAGIGFTHPSPPVGPTSLLTTWEAWRIDAARDTCRRGLSICAARTQDRTCRSRARRNIPR